VVKPTDAPRLTEWLTPTEAAAIFGISRQSVNDMIKNGEFETLHLIGPGSRPQYVIRRDEVERLKATRRFPRARTQNL
jgi:excisionase family DNA binding protein